MSRRILFAYAVVFAAGITAGYIFAEKCSPGAAAVFMCIFVAMFFAADRRREELIITPGRFSPLKLTAVMMAGTLIFMTSFVVFESFQSGDPGQITVRGRVVYAQDRGDRAVLDIEVCDAELPDGMRSITGSVVRCTLYSDDGTEIRKACGLYGSEVSAAGKAEVPEKRRNPGCFDYKLYLRTRGISFVMTAGALPEKCGSDVPLLWAFRQKIAGERDRFCRNFRRDAKLYGFMRGVVFGDTGAMDEETFREFRQNTTAHVLAVSGLHVGFIYAAIGTVSRKRKSVLIYAATAAAMILYGEMTMWNAATVRAVIVTIIAGAAFYVKKPFDFLSALSASFIAMLFCRPYLLFSTGFMMSFIATAGIAFAKDPLSRLVGRKLGFLASIQLVMTPFTAFAFNTFNPAGMAVNVPVVFLVGILVPASMLALVTGIITGTYPAFLTGAAGMTGEMTMELNHMLNAGGALSFSTVSVSAFTMLAAGVFAFFLTSEFFRLLVLRGRMKTAAKTAAAFLCALAIPGIVFGNSFLDDEIVFIDVGQGDAVHIRCEGHDVLIDGGGSPYTDLGEKVLKPYFLKNGTGSLDAVLFTHMHTDHAKAATELAEVFPVAKFGIPSGYSQEYEENSSTVMLGFGDVVNVGKGVTIRVIWPVEPGQMTSEDENEISNVYMIDWRGTKIMVTGDLVEKEERSMLEYYGGSRTLKCDVLKIAHHGSRYSSSEAFLDAADPEIAVIQVGEDNVYGHPSPQTLRRLRKRGVKVYRTDEHGAVGLDIRRSGIRIDRVIE